MNDILGNIFVAVGLLIAVAPLVIVGLMFINTWTYDIVRWFKH